MDENIRAEYESKSKDLRADLKKWESEWATSHNGKKPERSDIKSNRDIADKYKEYNRIRDVIAGRAALPQSDHKLKKRKADSIPAETPRKKSRHAETPSKDRTQDGEYMNSPAVSRQLFTPSRVTSIGPTPQRDGRVLGLFDLLVEKELGTPLKGDHGNTPARHLNIAATPSKRKGSFGGDIETPARLSRTPMSSSKRKMLDHFMTPLKKRGDDVVTGKTPSSFDTPAFLRRGTVPALDKDGQFAPVSTLRLPRKPLARGLSEIVAGLRRVEEETLDEDLEALREMERDQMGGEAPSQMQQRNKPDILMEDSQGQRLPLSGLDDEGKYDSPVAETKENTTTVYKKKGQKRTTRLVKMRPMTLKRPANMAQPEALEEEDEVLAPESQHTSAAGPEPENEAISSDPDSENENVPEKTKRPSKKKESTVKKTAKKVNELAHANFQRLKLKNHGAKGGPGYNSRFRRKR